MTISVFHMSREIPRQQRLELTALLADRAPLARRFYERGLYEHVAVVETDHLEDAWIETQNLHSSWSREPGPGVRVIGSGFITHKGEEYGYKSSEIGDLFRNDDTGEFYVCDTIGFKRVEGIV